VKVKYAPQVGALYTPKRGPDTRNIGAKAPTSTSILRAGAGEPNFFASKSSPSSLLARGKWVSNCLATWKTGLVPVEPGLTPTRTI